MDDDKTKIAGKVIGKKPSIKKNHQAGSNGKVQIIPPKRAIQPSDKTQFIKSQTPADNRTRITIAGKAKPNKKSRQNNSAQPSSNNNRLRCQYGVLNKRFACNQFWVPAEWEWFLRPRIN